MILTPALTCMPIMHGSLAFARHVRALCAARRYACIAVDFPEAFARDLCDAVDRLPLIEAVIAEDVAGDLFYAPVDPCDPVIEGVRQARQRRIPIRFIGYPVLAAQTPLPPLPDAHAASVLGFEEYATLCLRAVGNPEPGGPDDCAGQYIASRLRALETEYDGILALVHLRRFARMVRHFYQERTYNVSFPEPPPCRIDTAIINPDHLYFALGELPFVAGKCEQERQDPCAAPVDPLRLIVSLFTETRDDYFERKEDCVHLSPARIQRGLTFLRNLTALDHGMTPSLIDIVEAAKGIGGDAYAVRILKNAKYYPYLPEDPGAPLLSVGIDRIRLPGADEARRAHNLFRDAAIFWRAVSLKIDPSPPDRARYRYAWNPSGMCSHVPEDVFIERFNAHVRKKAERALTEDLVRTEPFTTSVKDGIAMRETIRDWHTGRIHVKEIPASRGTFDTIVIIFDATHDDLYPHCATWYAEHVEESTLTFYATDPFADLIGPGVARCYYGGLSLLFPPRPVPDIFHYDPPYPRATLAERLAHGAMLFSRERNVAFVAQRRPGVALTGLARQMKKRLIWIPIGAFSAETMLRLRRFHVLNGQQVRSWAQRFIGY